MLINIKFHYFELENSGIWSKVINIPITFKRKTSG